MSSLHIGHFDVPVRDRAAQFRAGLGAFLFAIAGVGVIWLSVLYVNRGAYATRLSLNRLLSHQIKLSDVNGVVQISTQDALPTESPPVPSLEGETTP